MIFKKCEIKINQLRKLLDIYDILYTKFTQSITVYLFERYTFIFLNFLAYWFVFLRLKKVHQKKVTKGDKRLRLIVFERASLTSAEGSTVTKEQFAIGRTLIRSHEIDPTFR